MLKGSEAPAVYRPTTSSWWRILLLGLGGAAGLIILWFRWREAVRRELAPGAW
jgi:hypothetical protein